VYTQWSWGGTLAPTNQGAEVQEVAATPVQDEETGSQISVIALMEGGQWSRSSQLDPSFWFTPEADVLSLLQLDCDDTPSVLPRAAESVLPRAASSVLPRAADSVLPRAADSLNPDSMSMLFSQGPSRPDQPADSSDSDAESDTSFHDWLQREPGYIMSARQPRSWRPSHHGAGTSHRYPPVQHQSSLNPQVHGRTYCGNQASAGEVGAVQAVQYPSQQSTWTM
jgi:hypothetical protein